MVVVVGVGVVELDQLIEAPLRVGRRSMDVEDLVGRRVRGARPGGDLMVCAILRRVPPQTSQASCWRLQRRAAALCENRRRGPCRRRP